VNVPTNGGEQPKVPPKGLEGIVGHVVRGDGGAIMPNSSPAVQPSYESESAESEQSEAEASTNRQRTAR